ncbi:MAG: N-acetylneuraminate synthase family protein [archaeon]|nr:N-acetylneuraminate synthase family protein [archaeon]
MEIFKISSGEITNKPLIQHVASKKKPIILSTGTPFLGEVEKAIGWINEIWNKLKISPKLTLLHCVSNYPANVEDSNLMAMSTMEVAFGLPVGYSDHSMGLDIPVAAVAMGATAIEKHFTLDRNMEGPDHKTSLEPDELEAMVRAVRNVEKALGGGIKRPTSCEDNMRYIVRKSLIAKRNIRKNDIFTAYQVFIYGGQT